MFRRSRKPAPPLHRKQQEIAQQEAQLREQVESLERLVTQSQAPPPPIKASARKPERTASNNVAEKRFHVSIAMEAPQLFDADQRRRPRALRKERRHGQIVFLILLIALAVAVMWLVSHLYP